jgi:translation initiation factor 2 beta subunit (eIF-2beta)/eIF-5
MSDKETVFECRECGNTETTDQFEQLMSTGKCPDCGQTIPVTKLFLAEMKKQNAGLERLAEEYIDE